MRASEEKRWQPTQARDAYVKEVEGKLAAIAANIDQMEEQASTREGADKDALNLHIEALQAQRDRAQEALDSIKDAESSDLAEPQGACPNGDAGSPALR